MTEQWAWKFNGREYSVMYYVYGTGDKRFWQEQGDDVTIVTWEND